MVRQEDPRLDAREEFARFLESYAGFLEEMVKEERVKFGALTSLDVEEVEQSVARQQAALKQLEQFEERREELQKENGDEGKTLAEIAGEAPSPLRERLQAAGERFSAAVRQIKRYNAESMDLVRENLDFIHSSKAGSALEGVNAYTPERRQNDDWGKGTTLFEKKI